jgi:hypothetical protein
MEGDDMAGRPPKQNKKVREAIYFEPDLLQWLKEKAEKQKCTVSVIVNVLVDEKRKEEGSS